MGGHKTFRPSILAQELKKYDVVNIGAAGTFVIRKPVSQAQLRAELQRRLPFETGIMICAGRDVVAMMSRDPFRNESVPSDVVRFVSVLGKRPRALPPLPISFPPDGPWLLKIIGCENRFIFGMYRRHMKAIGYLGKLDGLFGSPATTRNWNTFAAIAKVVQS